MIWWHKIVICLNKPEDLAKANSESICRKLELENAESAHLLNFINDSIQKSWSVSKSHLWRTILISGSAQLQHCFHCTQYAFLAEWKLCVHFYSTHKTNHTYFLTLPLDYSATLSQLFLVEMRFTFIWKIRHFLVKVMFFQYLNIRYYIDIHLLSTWKMVWNKFHLKKTKLVLNSLLVRYLIQVRSWQCCSSWTCNQAIQTYLIFFSGEIYFSIGV